MSGLVRISMTRHCGKDLSLLTLLLNAHQFINFKGKLNGSREKNMHRSIWNRNDQSSRGRVDGLLTSFK